MAKLLMLVLLAACGSDPARPDASVVSIDAPVQPDAAPLPLDAPSSSNLACLGQPAPTIAADPLPITGKLFAIDNYQISALAGAIVSVVRRTDDSVLATQTTASDGTFATMIASGGVAVDAYFTITADGFVTGRIDPVLPLTGDEHELVVVASEAEISRWYVDAKTTRTAGAAALIVAATDCDQLSLGATTATLSPTAALTYYDDVAKRWDPALAASTNGFMLVTNPATTITITAQHDGTAFPSHTITAPANTLTVATLPPEL